MPGEALSLPDREEIAVAMIEYPAVASAKVSVEVRDRVSAELRVGRFPGGDLGGPDGRGRGGAVRGDDLHRGVRRDSRGEGHRVLAVATSSAAMPSVPPPPPSSRPALPNIDERPDSVIDRSEIGYWEVDLFIGHLCLVTLSVSVSIEDPFDLITMPNGYSTH